MIHQLTTSIFDSFNLADPVEKLCDELLEPSPINFTEVFAGHVPPLSEDEEVSSPQCPSPGNQRTAPCSKSKIIYKLKKKRREKRAEESYLLTYLIGRTSRVLLYDLTGSALFDIGSQKWIAETKDLRRK